MPFVNGRFYMNPAYGRAVEQTRGTQQEPNAHWVTIDGRHVLIREASKSARDKIAAAARKYNGSTSWAYGKRKDDFPPNCDKCNKFVCDVAKEAGAEPIIIGSDGKPRPPLAAEWADPRTNISNWRALRPNEAPQPGDVAAYKLAGGGTAFSGHSGIVASVDADGHVHAIAAHADVVSPDDKFNSTRDRAVTDRRCEGGR